MKAWVDHVDLRGTMWTWKEPCRLGGTYGGGREYVSVGGPMQQLCAGWRSAVITNTICGAPLLPGQGQGEGVAEWGRTNPRDSPFSPFTATTAIHRHQTAFQRRIARPGNKMLSQTHFCILPSPGSFPSSPSPLAHDPLPPVSKGGQGRRERQVYL